MDEFPLYWAEKPKLKKPWCLEDLPPQDREVCNLLSELQAPFNMAELLKLEFRPKTLKGYIGTCLTLLMLIPLCLCTIPCSALLCFVSLRRYGVQCRKEEASS